MFKIKYWFMNLFFKIFFFFKNASYFCNELLKIVLR